MARLFVFVMSENVHENDHFLLFLFFSFLFFMLGSFQPKLNSREEGESMYIFTQSSIMKYPVA